MMRGGREKGAGVRAVQLVEDFVEEGDACYDALELMLVKYSR